MKYKGYMGKILEVDLTARRIEAVPLSEKLAEDYVGGAGIAAKIICDTATPEMEPLDPANPLVFMTGPLTGTIIPWSGRHAICALSPLTGIWGESYAGGTWGKELKRAGFDGIIVTGKADRPVYLKVTDQAVTIEDAQALTGRDTYETEALLRQECGEKAKVAAIGAGGENLVRFAAVVHDGPAARTAGRCGIGAVMGSKNLKALAVAGSQPIKLAEREALRKSIEAFMPKPVNDPEHRLQKVRLFSAFLDNPSHAVRNWQAGDLEGFKQSVLEEAERHVWEGKPYLCAGCRTGCIESNVSGGERQLVWESFAPLGSQCGVTDMEYVKKAYALCNRHGIDSISAGGVISFAMECFEEGIITEKETEGIRLTFGNGDGMLTMLEKVCKREGFGSVLAEGTRKAAKQIGGGAERLAIEVKGLEVPAHDPRTHNMLALTYATDNKGANHMSIFNPLLEGLDRVNLMDFRFNIGDIPSLVIRRQDYAAIVNSLLLCSYSQEGHVQYTSPVGFPGLTAKEVTEWFNLATGMEKDFDSLMRLGEKLFNLKHVINVRRGFDPASDSLPERLVTVKREKGAAADHLPPVKDMVEGYYRLRGWEPSGRIKPGKLKELGLKEL
jgi:aldehyde:ferredoxin oxidoreductase